MDYVGNASAAVAGLAISTRERVIKTMTSDVVVSFPGITIADLAKLGNKILSHQKPLSRQLGRGAAIVRDGRTPDRPLFTIIL